MRLVSEPVQRLASEDSDADLVLAARAGDARAKELLFKRHARMVNGLVFRLMGGPAEVRDLVQEAFVEALRGLDSLRSPEFFSSWLGAIVIRTVHKHLRRRSLMTRLGFGSKLEVLDAETLVSPEAPPDVLADLRRIYRTIDKLPPRLRIVLMLRRVEGLALPDIAQQMNISLATTKRWITKAEGALAKGLKSPWREGGA